MFLFLSSFFKNGISCFSLNIQFIPAIILFFFRGIIKKKEKENKNVNNSIIKNHFEGKQWITLLKALLKN